MGAYRICGFLGIIKLIVVTPYSNAATEAKTVKVASAVLMIVNE
jgi:hypothetical protein